MTAALILAANIVPEESVRKPTDDIYGTSSIKIILMVFRQAGIRNIAVVTGYDADEIENHCGHKGVVFLHNDDYESGDIMSSIKVGLDYFKDKCDRLFIAPADVPLFSVETIKSMMETTEQVIIPVCRTVTGHPILLSKSLFNKALEYDGTLGLGDFLSGEGIELRYLNVRDEGILIDAQNNEDISEITMNHGLRKIRAEAKVTLSCWKDFFGPGVFLLLTLVTETGSLVQAAKRMGLSLSKANQVVANAEKQLGYKLLESKRGGEKGGASKVTEDALDLMRKYEAVESDVTDALQISFERHFNA